MPINETINKKNNQFAQEPLLAQDVLPKVVKDAVQDIRYEPKPQWTGIITDPNKYDADGNLSNDYIEMLTGDVGQRLGYTPARDEGFLREFGKSFKRGLLEMKASYANTFGMDGAKADIDYFLSNNQQLYDSERKGTWSYISGIIGNQLGANLPLLASMAIPGGLVGRVGQKALAGVAETATARLAQRVATKTVWNTAEKATYESLKKKAIERATGKFAEEAISRKVLATRATTMGMMGAMLWGDNMDELRERMPGVDETSLLAINLLLTPLQAFIEVSPFGWESKTARAVGRLTLGNAMAKGQIQDSIVNTIKPGLWGKVSRLGETFPGRMVKVGMGETFEEILQEASMDLTVNAFKTDKTNDQTAEEFVQKYGQILKESFIGGVGLGFIPATLNSIANARRKSTIKRISEDDPVKREKVDEFNTRVVDVAAPLRTKTFFDAMEGYFGQEGTAIIRNTAYNLAYLKQKAQEGKPIEEREIATPESFFTGLNTLIVQDPGKFQNLRDAFIRGPREGVEMMNEMFPEIKNDIIRWSDIDTMNDLDRTHAGWRAEINEKAGVDMFDKRATETAQEQGRRAVAAELGGKQEGDYLTVAAKHVNEFVGSDGRVINPGYLANVLNKLGVTAKNLYAMEWIRKIPVKVGDTTKLFAIRLGIDRENRISGILYEDSAAEGLVEREARRKIEEPEKAVEATEIVKEKDKDIPAMLVNAEPLARKATESVRLGNILNRMKEFDEHRKVEAAKPPITPVEDVLTFKPYAETIAERRKQGNVDEKEKRIKRIKSDLLMPDTDKAALKKELAQLEEDVIFIEAGDFERKLNLTQAREKIEGEVLTAKKQKVKPKEKAKITGEPAIYVPAYRLGLFSADIKNQPRVFVEEALHHLIVNDLMPHAVQQVFLDNFGVPSADGENLYLDRAGHENAARALLAYLSKNQLPDNPALADALGTASKIIASAPEIRRMAMTARGPVETDMPLKISDELNAIFDNLLSEVTPDKVSEIYGEALDASLSMSEPIRWVDEQRMFNHASIVSHSRKMTSEQYLNSIVLEMTEALEGKESINDLTLPQKLVVQNRIDADLQEVMDRKGGKRVLDTIETDDVLGPPPVLTAKPLKEMDKGELSRFAHVIATPEQLHGRGDQESQNIPLQMFGKRWGELTDSQRIKVVESIRQTKKTISRDVEAIAKVVVDNIKPSLRGDLTILNSDNMFTKAGKWAAQKAIHFVNRVETIRGLVNILAENNPDSPLVKVLSNPIAIATDNATIDYSEGHDSLIKKIKKGMEALGRSWELPYAPIQIGNRTFTKSQAVYFYVQSNAGLNMDANSNLAKIAVLNNLGKTTESALDTVREMVKAVKADPDMMAFIDVTQKVMTDYLVSRAAPVFKEMTGKDVKPIKDLYITIANRGGTTLNTDINAIFEHLGGAPAVLKAGLTPREFFKRGTGAERMVNDDYYGLVFRHLATMANYANKAKPVRNIMQALNTPAVHKAFRDKNLQAEYLETFQDLLRREMSPSGKLNMTPLVGDKTIRFLTGNAPKVFLAWNIGPVLNQGLSVPLFTATVPARMAGKFALNLLDAFAQTAMFRKTEDTHYYKLLKQYSPNFLTLRPDPETQRINEILENKIGIGLGSKAGLVFNKLLDMGIKPLQLFDILPRMVAWGTAFEGKLDMLADTNLTQDAKIAAAKSFADDAVNKSFNPASRAERGLAQSEAGEYGKSLMMFTSQPFASCRWFISDLMLPTLKAWNTGKLTGVVKAWGTDPTLFYKLAMGVFIPGIALGMLGRRRPQDNLKEVFTDALLFGIANHIPVLGHIMWFNAAMGFSGSGADLGGIHGRLTSSILKVIGDVIGGKANFNTLRDAEMTIEMLTRIPDYPVRVIHKFTENIILKDKDASIKNLKEILFGKTTKRTP